MIFKYKFEFIKLLFIIFKILKIFIIEFSCDKIKDFLILSKISSIEINSLILLIKINVQFVEYFDIF